MTISDPLRAAALAVSLALALLAAPPAAAHPGGHVGDPVGREVVVPAAMDVKTRLVQEGKIDFTWAMVEPAKADQIDNNGEKEWLVLFHNPAVADPAKRILYIFFTIEGMYLAANYTGR
ncbi:DUF6488 family protein [Magnetospirillum sp. UT-4]|uniref:DUF6488 family protein n=1 Tax=Magnetospirillum sp. UT-4 TaxID=2681467 RepID=UPI00138404DD|nr:DUF6488 family protein [Magnetospirillum sp. UT-4]CAA7624401.1 conserved exported hypothetical protein [Magnetospirillum sp. UT-4]